MTTNGHRNEKLHCVNEEEPMKGGVGRNSQGYTSRRVHGNHIISPHAARHLSWLERLWGG